MIFKRGGKKNSGAFPSLDTDGRAQHRQYGAMVAPPSTNLTERPFNPENYVINTAETVTVSTLTNDRAFHSMKRFNCGFDYDQNKNNRGSIDNTPERKNWYKNKKQNQTYIPLRDNGSAFTAPESSFGMSEAGGPYHKKSTKVPLGIRCSVTLKWLGRYAAAKSPTWSSRGKGRWNKGESGEVVMVGTGYSSVGSRSRSSSECSADKDGKGILSSVCLNYCDDSGEREEQLVWDK